jgi:hypothetical protein
VAELPGLVVALTARYGAIRSVMLNNDAWDSRFRRLAVGTGVVRMGWFASLNAALLVATTDQDEQVDLLVVPPETAAAAAERALAMAADPTNLVHAPDILAARPAPPKAAPGNGPDPDAVSDTERGSTGADRPHRAAGELSTVDSS